MSLKAGPLSIDGGQVDGVLVNRRQVDTEMMFQLRRAVVDVEVLQLMSGDVDERLHRPTVQPADCTLRQHAWKPHRQPPDSLDTLES